MAVPAVPGTLLAIETGGVNIALVGAAPAALSAAAVILATGVAVGIVVYAYKHA